jgi:2-octaprenyl-6-methoxyphenol hydroxylase
MAHQFFMPSGPLAILPLKGGHHSSIVWSETDATAAAIQALPDAEYLEALRPRFGDFLGGISLAGERFTYPLSLSLAERFIAPRVALVGDAAHGVHPIAGQGLNLGLRDVAALAEVLILPAAAARSRASPVALEEYQRWRRFDSTALALGHGHGQPAVFQRQPGAAAGPRPRDGAGQRACPAAPPLHPAGGRPARGTAAPAGGQADLAGC